MPYGESDVSKRNDYSIGDSKQKMPTTPELYQTSDETFTAVKLPSHCEKRNEERSAPSIEKSIDFCFGKNPSQVRINQMT